MVLFWFGLVKKRSSVNLCYHSPIAPKWLRWLLVNLATKSESGWWFGFVVSDSRHPWSVLLTVWSCWHAQSQQWRRNEPDGVSNHQPHDCLLNRLFRRRSKKTSKLRVTGLCAENSPVTGEFPAQRASNAENVSIWWRHHVLRREFLYMYSETCL